MNENEAAEAAYLRDKVLVDKALTAKEIFLLGFERGVKYGAVIEMRHFVELDGLRHRSFEGKPSAI